MRACVRAFVLINGHSKRRKLHGLLQVKVEDQQVSKIARRDRIKLWDNQLELAGRPAISNRTCTTTGLTVRAAARKVRVLVNARRIQCHYFKSIARCFVRQCIDFKVSFVSSFSTHPDRCVTPSSNLTMRQRVKVENGHISRS